MPGKVSAASTGVVRWATNSRASGLGKAGHFVWRHGRMGCPFGPNDKLAASRLSDCPPRTAAAQVWRLRRSVQVFKALCCLQALRLPAQDCRLPSLEACPLQSTVRVGSYKHYKNLGQGGDDVFVTTTCLDFALLFQRIEMRTRMARASWGSSSALAPCSTPMASCRTMSTSSPDCRPG